VTSHEDLGIVLIKSTLVVTNSWHVLDDDAMIGVFTLLVKNSVGGDHVIDDIRLGDLLGAELLLGAEVLSVVVTKMIVAGNSSELDTSTDQEVNKSGLHLGLTRLEVITTNERTMSLCKLDATRNKCILWRTIDERCVLEDASNSEDGGRSNFLVSVLDSL
jgi:hypothetical protein